MNKKICTHWGHKRKRSQTKMNSQLTSKDIHWFKKGMWQNWFLTWVFIRYKVSVSQHAEFIILLTILSLSYYFSTSIIMCEHTCDNGERNVVKPRRAEVRVQIGNLGAGDNGRTAQSRHQDSPVDARTGQVARPLRCALSETARLCWLLISPIPIMLGNCLAESEGRESLIIR